MILADIAREGANQVVDGLRDLGVPDEGTIHLEPVPAWLSQRGFDAERSTPGEQRGLGRVGGGHPARLRGLGAELDLSQFMSLATLIASIAIILDSQILVIGAMVLGPEFVPIAALGLALVRRRRTLFRRALQTLVLGFAVSILIATLLALLARSAGWVNLTDVVEDDRKTDFIYTPDKWSFLVAVAAAAAGVLSLTSAKVGGLSGVFISVTTVPASGNVALGLAFGAWHEVAGSGLQLLVNLTGMALAGWATLAFQQAVWSRLSAKRAALTSSRRRTPAADDHSG